MDRFEICPGLDGYVCRFPQTSGHRVGTVLRELELGVCLSGQYMVQTTGEGGRAWVHGRTYALDAATPVDSAYRASEDDGCLVMFTVSPDLVPGAMTDRDRELRLARFGMREGDLVELAQSVCIARAKGRNLSAQIRDVVLEQVLACSELSAPDPIVLARREIEEHWQHDLYLRHLAESSGVHPATFLRRFRRRYGVTPIQYRIKLRLNQAARMAWLEPDRPLKDIAQECGFAHEQYFSRAYRRYFGASPGRHRLPANARLSNPDWRQRR